MASIPLIESSLASLKKCLREYYPDISSSHLTEALATALGFKTHAALRAALPAQSTDPIVQLIDNSRFIACLNGFGYSIVDDEEDDFELFQNCPDLISTIPISGYEIEYKTVRTKAWRNLIVLTINEGIRQKLFSVRPFDNRWPGAVPQEASHRGTGYVFDFSLPNGKPVKGYVGDAGFGELSIHAAVNPKGDFVKAAFAGFNAGDAYAATWLERKTGTWFQSSTELFNCRKWLINELAELNVQPLGYGDRGRIIL